MFCLTLVTNVYHDISFTTVILFFSFDAIGNPRKKVRLEEESDGDLQVLPTLPKPPVVVVDIHDSSSNDEEEHITSGIVFTVLRF